jgi:hypothetical protein
MRRSPRLRAVVAAALAAVTLPVLACAPAAADGTPAPVTPSTVATPPVTPPVTPSTVATPPSRYEVSEARAAAAAVAAEVEALTQRLERSEARLEALQLEVAEAVTAHERAEEQLAEAQDAADRAAAGLAAAREARAAADEALSAEAALLYMQGGSLQNLATLLLTPTNTMADLSLVLDGNARRVQQDLDSATAAAWEAAAREKASSATREERAAAAAAAAETREAVEREAERAGAQAARLGAQQERLAARLEELRAGAEDLEARRAAAAGLGVADLLGLQGDATAGGAPQAARETAREMLPTFGWDTDDEYTCLVALWHAESGWSWSATNRSSGAYGIPQALPGWKMASAGSDWLTNPATQIAWGLGYIDERYGSPCAALDAFLGRTPHWY